MAETIVLVGLGIFIGLMVTQMESEKDPDRKPFDPDDYRDKD